MFRVTWLLAGLTLTLGVVGQAQAGPTSVTDPLGTYDVQNGKTVDRASDWDVTWGYNKTPVTYTAYAVDVTAKGQISVTSTGRSDGKVPTVVSSMKGGISNFDGLWVATETFYIPKHATNVQLVFSGFTADDRAVLQLNGTRIGDANLDNLTANGTALMTFPNSSGNGETTNKSFSFGGSNSTSGTITSSSDFLLGQTNQLAMIINNTAHGGDLTLPTIGLTNSSNSTEVALRASLSYNLVPEPGTLTLGALSAACFGFRAWRRKKLAVV